MLMIIGIISLTILVNAACEIKGNINNKALSVCTEEQTNQVLGKAENDYIQIADGTYRDYRDAWQSIYLNAVRKGNTDLKKYSLEQAKKYAFEDSRLGGPSYTQWESETSTLAANADPCKGATGFCYGSSMTNRDKAVTVPSYAVTKKEITGQSGVGEDELFFPKELHTWSDFRQWQEDPQQFMEERGLEFSDINHYQSVKVNMIRANQEESTLPSVVVSLLEAEGALVAVAARGEYLDGLTEAEAEGFKPGTTDYVVGTVSTAATAFAPIAGVAGNAMATGASSVTTSVATLSKIGKYGEEASRIANAAKRAGALFSESRRILSVEKVGKISNTISRGMALDASLLSADIQSMISEGVLTESQIESARTDDDLLNLYVDAKQRAGQQAFDYSNVQVFEEPFVVTGSRVDDSLTVKGASISPSVQRMYQMPSADTGSLKNLGADMYSLTYTIDGEKVEVVVDRGKILLDGVTEVSLNELAQITKSSSGPAIVERSSTVTSTGCEI